MSCVYLWFLLSLFHFTTTSVVKYIWLQASYWNCSDFNFNQNFTRIWSFYNHCVWTCSPLSSRRSNLLINHTMFAFCCCVCLSICDLWLICWILCVFVGPWGMLWTAVSCYDTVLLTPKAVWLLLQAAVPMATFHSHLFSIWLWHIHMNALNDMTTSCPTEFNCAILRLISLFDFDILWNVSVNYKQFIWDVYAKSLHYVSGVGPVGIGDVVFWCEWSGYSYPLFSHNATLHDKHDTPWALFFPACLNELIYLMCGLTWCHENKNNAKQVKSLIFSLGHSNLPP